MDVIQEVGTGLEFEDRSDYLENDALVNWNVGSDFFLGIHSELLGTGSRLLEGPRGTGKTHQMRIAYMECVKGPDRPVAVFVSLNRYFHLEPLLTKDADAIKIFHSWVLSKIILGITRFCRDTDANYQVVLTEFKNDEKEITIDSLLEFESLVESPYAIDEKKYDFSISLNITSVTNFLERITQDFNRRRAVILLDDAALTLTPEYFVEFLDIFRSLKTKIIAPKASVYPGTTQYSSKFHVGHDAQVVNCWMSVENEKYEEFMSSLLDIRFRNHLEGINPEIINIIKYAAFGVPRTLIGLLRAYKESTATERTTQARFNSVIDKRSTLAEAEYLSLKKKMLQYEDIIGVGWTFFKTIIEQLKNANQDLAEEKLIEFGILEEDQKMLNRMIGFLKEAGLLYELTSTVKHGNDREYRRFIPHLLFLINNRTFSRGRGFNATETQKLLQSKNKKHPLRRVINTVLTKQDLDKLKLNLPPCQKCNTKRLTEVQKFCHNCGSQLINKSSFEECMSMTISELPLTEWQKAKLTGIQISTIGDFLSLANPGGELRKAKGIGKVRSERITSTIKNQVNEILDKALIDFLS